MNAVKMYSKKPVKVEAVQLTQDNLHDVARWCGGRVIEEAKASDPTDVFRALEIPTLEGTMRALVNRDWTPDGYLGDYVIHGVAGEFYACKPDIFAETYEEVQR